ncbi:CpsD/CapB family tyrosine-protein kinase [Mucisphaera sp.]|uniref:CpsD/CapB family tyrosine-protein kinase n=1 Tax=Mucisphaera sp. TaxID=2913024 RepID=UPI003D0D3DC6
MGYIFDALNRSDDQHEPNPDATNRKPDQAWSTPYTKAPKATEPVEQTAAPTPFGGTGPFASILEDPELTDGLDGQTQAAQPISDPNPEEPPAAYNTLQDMEDAQYGPLGSIGTQDNRQANQFDDRVVVATNPSAKASEEYRLIRTSMLARWEQRRNLIHTITSATPKEGKTISTINLGLSFAELHERNTIVVEADLRLPSFEDMLRLGATTGLLAYLRGEAQLDQAIARVPGTRLSVMTAGGRAGREAVGLIGSQRMKHLLVTLRQRYDHVIIDTPPVLDLADAGILGGLSDEVLLVARMRHTPRPLIEQATRVLKSYQTPIGGVIATDQEEIGQSYSYAYSYRYRYRYTEQLREAA